MSILSRLAASAFLLAAVGPLFAAPKLPLVEDFDDDRHGWSDLGDNEKSFGEIANGVLFFENLELEGSDMHPTIPLDLDMARDFSLDLRIKYASGTDNRGYGFNLGRDGNKAYHTLSVSGNQWYIVSSYTGSEWSSRVSWTEDPALVKRDDYNMLSLRKIGSQWFFLINGEVVDQAALARPENSTVGIHLPSGSAIEADSLRVAYLTESEKQRAALAAQLEEQLHARRIKSGPALEDFVETFEDNRNEWPWISEGETWSGKIQDGALHWANRSDGAQITYIQKPVNARADYELSLRFTHLAGPIDNSIGIKFGRSDDGAREQFFGIAPNGYYIFQVWDDGVSTTPIPWTKIDLVKPEANEIVLRKVHDRAFLHVNGQLLADIPAPELFGGATGVSISGGMTVAFDELAIRYFSRTRAESIAAMEALDKQLVAIHRGGKVKGAVHAMSAARERDEENERARDAELLSDKDYKQLNKVRKQFTGKSKLSLFASWKRPSDILGNPNGSHRIYYNYKLKGRKQYYYEFQITYVGSSFDIHGKPIPLDPELFAINGIQLTDRKW